MISILLGLSVIWFGGFLTGWFIGNTPRKKVTMSEQQETYGQPKDPRYRVEAGRQIYRDGKPWLYIGGCRDEHGNSLYNPCAADRLVYLVVDLLNSGYEYDESSRDSREWGWKKK